MGKVVRLASRRGKGQKRRRRQGRLRNAPWQPLAALLAVAGGLWLAAALSPGGSLGTDALATGGSASFVLCAGAPRPNCVIDGDTIRIGGIKICLADIDAPEVFSPKCASEAARGRRATERLLALVNAGPFDAGPRRHSRRGSLRPQAAGHRARRPLARRHTGRRRPGPPLGRRPPQLVRVTREVRSRAPGRSIDQARIAMSLILADVLGSFGFRARSKPRRSRPLPRGAGARRSVPGSRNSIKQRRPLAAGRHRAPGSPGHPRALSRGPKSAFIGLASPAAGGRG